MGDCYRRGNRGDFAAADGEDDKVVALRGALRAGSAGLRICGADCESGTGVAVVLCATRASNGFRISGTWFGRCNHSARTKSQICETHCATRASNGFRISGTWFGRSGCTAASELFDSNVWLAPCTGNRRAYADGSGTSRGNLDYPVNSGKVRPAARSSVLE